MSINDSNIIIKVKANKKTKTKKTKNKTKTKQKQKQKQKQTKQNKTKQKTNKNKTKTKTKKHTKTKTNPHTLNPEFQRVSILLWRVVHDYAYFIHMLDIILASENKLYNILISVTHKMYLVKIRPLSLDPPFFRCDRRPYPGGGGGGAP